MTAKEWNMENKQKTKRRRNSGTVLLEYVMLNMVLAIVASSIFFCANEMGAYGVSLLGFSDQMKSQFQRLNNATAFPVP